MSLLAPPNALSNPSPFALPKPMPLSFPISARVSGGLTGLALITGAVDLIGELGANQWRDSLLAKIGGQKTVSTDNGDSQGNQPIDPNASYKWFYPINGNTTIGYGWAVYIGTYQQVLETKRIYFADEPPYPVLADSNGNFPSNANELAPKRPAFIGDAQVSSPNGLQIGNVPRFSEGLENPNKPLLTPNFSSAIGWGDSKAIDGRAALGIGSPLTNSPKLNSVPSSIGIGTPTALKPPTPTRRQNEEEKKTPQTEADKEKERQKILQREADKLLANINGGNASITSQIAGLGAIIGTINANTQPDAQRLNAKNGSCDALNSPSCTKGMEDRIKDPINGKVDDVAGKVAATASSLDLVKNVAENSFKFISRIYNNQFIHSSLSFMTTMTTIHNAAMLSRDVAETLGTVVDNSINLSGNKLKDADGNDINFTSWIGSNIRAIIVQLIGADKYVQLALQWQKANTIYHSAMAVVNTTQSMLDPLSSAVEYGMENVSKIGNGLREDGVVSENSYPAMDETIRARRVNRFERLNDTLEGAENISSNLSSITGSAVSVKEDFRQLREDQKQLRDQAANFNAVDEQARAELKASLPTQITPINLTPAPEEETP